MPVRMRLATKGAARNESMDESIMMSPSAYLLRGALNRVDQQIDVVVEQLEVVGHFLDASDRRRHHEDFRARFAPDGIRRLQIEIRLDEDDLDVLPLHLVYEIQRVLRRRRDARTRFDIADDVEAEALSEIRKRSVVRHNLRAFMWRHRRQPPLLGFVESAREGSELLLKIRAVVRPKLRELIGDLLPDALSVLRVKPVVRIAKRMHIAHRACNLAGRDLENFHLQRAVEISLGARLNP